MDTPTLRLLLPFLLFWGLSVPLRLFWIDPAYSVRSEERSQVPDILTSPGPSVLGAVSFEHPLAWADLIWLAIVQEIGAQKGASPAAWDRVERWSEIATDLDPRYFIIYHSAAVNLSVYAERAESSDQLLLKGWRALPERWELALLLGYNAYFLRHDLQLASEYMSAAGQIPGAPHFLAALAGRMRYQAGDEAGAIALLELMMVNLEGPAREDAEQRLEMLKSEPLLRRYDAACRRWKEERGEVPTARALFEAQWVPEEPLDRLGFEIDLDETCIARTKLIRLREFEAVERLEKKKKDGEIQTQNTERTP